MENNKDIIRSVQEQLYWDASVDETNIKVEVTDHTIVLDGNVPEYMDRQHAEIDALAVAGSMDVDNRLIISYPDESPADADRDLAARIRKSLASDPAAAFSRIMIDVNNGTVNMDGFVDTHRKKLRAAELAADIKGVVAVNNRICLVPDGHAGDEALAVTTVATLTQNGKGIDTNAIDIEVNDGLVTLYGTVPDIGSRQKAEAAVRAIDGAAGVDNRLLVI